MEFKSMLRTILKICLPLALEYYCSGFFIENGYYRNYESN
jgi:hypothetical protein